MDKLNSKKILLEQMKLLEGAEFECDEKAILEEYQKQQDNGSSLAIKILSILGGFFATLAFLGFLALAGLYDSESGLLIFGVGFIISAIWLNKVYDKLIIDTFSISIYVIGFALLAFSLLQLHVDENLVATLICLIALSALFITQNYILSFISVLTISGSLLTLIISNDLYHLIHVYIAFHALLLTYVFLSEAKLISLSLKGSKLFNPVRIGLIFSLLLGLVVIGKRDLIPFTQKYIWVSSIVLIALMMYLAHVITRINKVESKKSNLVIYSLSFLILVSTVFSPAITGALAIILLSFLVNYKSGFVIGIISFLYFVSQYYYDLSFTLLTKSIILFSSGIVFLSLYLFVAKNLNAHEKV